MKKIFSLLISVIWFASAFAQYPSNTNIEPGHKKTTQWVQISNNGKELLSTKKHKNKAGDNPVVGTYNEYPLQQLVDSIRAQVRQEISDSLALSGGGFFTSSTAIDNTEQDCDDNNFTIKDVNDFYVYGTGEATNFDLNPSGNQFAINTAGASVYGDDTGLHLTASDSTYTFGQLPHIDTGQVTHTFGINSADGTLAVTPVKYKVYTALLTQSGTSAPVATVLENTLGGTVVWTRNNTGDYTGTLANAFPANKVVLPHPAIDVLGTETMALYAYNTTSSIDIFTYTIEDGIDAPVARDDAMIMDGLGIGTFCLMIEIRVYN